MKNHDIIAPTPSPAGRLEELDIPTLVIHGRDDPVFPVEHGRALVERIRDAHLLIVERMGHELPRVAWDEVVPAIVEHTARP